MTSTVLRIGLRHVNSRIARYSSYANRARVPSRICWASVWQAWLWADVEARTVDAETQVGCNGSTTPELPANLAFSTAGNTDSICQMRSTGDR